MELYSVTEAAQELSLSTSRLRRLLIAGILEGTKVGKQWTITSEELERFRNTPRPVGRPRRRPRDDSGGDSNAASNGQAASHRNGHNSSAESGRNGFKLGHPVLCDAFDANVAEVSSYSGS